MTFAGTNDLQATVTPGYSFSASERVTLQKLNLLGTPTVAISGTVPGATISTNSIGKQHLLTNVFDQLYLSGGADATATIIAQSINGTRIATNAIGGTNITDGTVTWQDVGTGTLTATNLLANWPKDLAAATPATNDLVLLADASASSNLVQTTLVSAQQAGWFVSGEMDINVASFTTNVAHGLGRMPYLVRAVLVCKSANGNWETGQEVDLATSSIVVESPPGSGSFFDFVGVAYGADPTNAWLVLDAPFSTRLSDRATGSAFTITPSVWRAKVYAW